MEKQSTAGEKLLKDREKGFVKALALCRAQKGGEYQVKIAELFVILALKKENIRYNLSMEDTSAGKFDDLVLKVLHQGQSINWFLQAKHRKKGAKITFNDLLFEQKGEFSLRKYFQSFLDTWERKGSTEAFVSRYVIYTQALLDFDSNQTDETFSYITYGNKSLRFRKVTEEHDLLDTCSYLMYELLADDFIKRHLRKTSDATDENIEDFLQHFRFAVGQPTVEELSDILLNKVKEVNTHIDPKILRDNIYLNLHNWFVGHTQESKYFTEMQVAKIILQQFSETCKTCILLDVTFLASDLVGKIWQTNKSVIHISTCNPKLCCNKLISHPDVSKETLLLNFEDFVNVSNIVLPCLPLHKELLILVLYDMETNSELWEDSLRSLLERFLDSRDQMEKSNIDRQSTVDRQLTSVRRLLLVSSSSSGVNMPKMPELHNNIFYVQDDTYTFESLSHESQDLIMKKEVTFQGDLVAFNTLCTQDYMPPFDSHDIETLASESHITLDERATSVGKKLEIFIPRKLYVKNILEVDSLHELADELFIIIAPIERNTSDLLLTLSSCLNLSRTDLPEKHSNIYLVSAEAADAEFATQCQQFPDKAIHKLKMNKFWSSIGIQSISLQWLQTHGKIDALFKYIKESETADVAMIKQKPIAIVAAEPGMGKTTLLSHIAEEDKQNHSDRWVVNVSLKHVASKLLDVNPSDSISTIAKCLSELILEGESSLSMHLFQHSLEVTGNFILLLDGYDEIGPKEEREKVRIVLQKLKENSLGQVIITTRLDFKEELELAVSAIAYRLKPLTTTKQEKLLAETWIKNLGISSNMDKIESVYVYARKLVKDFYQKIDEGIKSLIGIPLLVTLLCEVYERKCRLFCNKKGLQVESVIIGIDNVLMLYRRFEDKKYEDFYARELTEGASVNESIRTMITDDHRNTCAEIALQELFPYTEFPCNCCLRREPRKQQILKEDQILRIGILQKTDGRGLTFIHRTFAEYFFAIYHILQMKKYCKKFVKVFKSGFYESRFSMIRLFLDIALVTSRIHNAALTNDVDRIEEELEKGTSVNLRDALGRTPCHLAASYGHVEAAELLLTRGCNTHIKDGLHKYTPAEVAAKVGNWEICSLFLAKRRNIELDIENKCTLFRYICQNGKAESLEQMLSNVNLCLKDVFHFKQIFYSTNGRGHTGLYIALENGNVEVVRILLDKCTDYSVHSIENELIRGFFKFSSCDMERKLACVNLLAENKIASHYAGSLLNVIAYSFLERDWVFFYFVQCLLECDVPLTDVALFILLHGGDYELEKLFMKVREVHDDVVFFILQPFESNETMLHFAAFYSEEDSVIFLIKTLETEGENILQYILPPVVQQLSLWHHAVRRKQIKLCDLYIQKVRESGGNVGEYISQKDHLGRTSLHWSAYQGLMGMVKYLILKMRDEQTPVLEGRSKLSLVSCDESSDEIQFFETLYLKIMKHGSNLLAYILQTDSAQMNIFHFLGVYNGDHTCNQYHKIHRVCCVKWIREQMKDEIVKLHQAILKTFSPQNFMNFLILKSIEKRKTVTYFISSEKLRLNALSEAVSGNHFEIFKLLTEEIEKEGADLIHFIVKNCYYGEYDSVIELSADRGHIQILEFILQKIKCAGGDVLDCNPYYVRRNKYITQTFLECLMNEKVSSSQLEADVMRILKEDSELKYSVHGLAKFCDITVLRIYFEIIRQNGVSLEYYITRRNNEGKTCVHCAAERGRKEVVEYLLEELDKEFGDCSHCFYPNEEGWTLLHSAAVGGNTCLVGFLLYKIRKYKFNTFEYILLETNDGQSAIHCASSKCHAEVVKLLLTVIEMRSSVLVAHILCKQEYKNTLLCDAASNGDAELLDFVLQKCTRKERERDVLKRGSKLKKNMKFTKYTANLRGMKIMKRTRIVRKSSSIFRFVFGNCKSSPVYYAIRHDNVQVIQFLFENVGSKRVRNDLVKNLVNCFHGTNTRSPFQYAHTHGSWKCLSYLIQVVINRVKYLKNYLYSRDQHGKTLLHYSISSGNVSVSTLLLQTMCEEEGEDIFQWSLWSSMTLDEFLQSILKKRNTELFLLVLRLIQKENGNILSLFCEQFDTEKSVFYYLANYVDREVLELLSKEAEKESGNILHYLSTTDSDGKIPLEEAVFCKNYEAAEYLIGVIKEGGGNVLDYFCEENFISRVVFRVIKGATEEIESKEEEHEEHLSVLKKLNYHLEECRADAFRNDMTEVGNLFCHVAESVKQNFLNYIPPDINVKAQIHLAIETGNIEMLDFIFRRKEELSIFESLNFVEGRRRGRRSVFHIAAISGDKNVMEFLFRKVKQKRGGSCSLLRIMSGRDNIGNTPFYYAVKGGDIELVKFLLKTIKEEILSNDHCTQECIEQ